MMENQRNIELPGTSMAPGMAMGKAFIYRDILEDDLFRYEVKPDQVDEECERIHRAAEQVLQDLDKSSHRITQQLGSYQAEIFTAHQAILRELLRSKELRQEMERKHVNAEVAIQRVFRRWAGKMKTDKNKNIMERTADIMDLGRQLERTLMGMSVHPLEEMPEDSVLVASQLLPSDAVFFSGRDTAAIAVERGGPASHCALMVRQMGIPGIYNVTDATEQVTAGELLLVDGFRGVLVKQPNTATSKRFEKRIKSNRKRSAKAKKQCREPAVTADGTRIPVMANIANREDVQVAVENGADGVGLYRLEGLFMLRKNVPTETELLDEISETLRPLKDKPALIRLLDIGSDKNLPYLNFDEEPAPCFGMRGVRRLLAHPELLRVQIRALLRLSQSRSVQIMVPMVTIKEDMQAVRRMVQSEASEVGISDTPPLVAMIETPAAALSVREILEFADALSLGTNDLTQYTMAAGRQNHLVHRYFKDNHPAVFRLIQIAGAEAGEATLGICGELAGRPDAVGALLSNGINLLSVAPPLIPTIKDAVRQPRIWQE